MSETWEYRLAGLSLSLEQPDKDIETKLLERLNGLGAEGWEAVGQLEITVDPPSVSAAHMPAHPTGPRRSTPPDLAGAVMPITETRLLFKRRTASAT